MDESNVIGNALAEVIKVSNLKDGGARVTIDIGYQDIEIIKVLLEKSMSPQKIIHVAFVEPERGLFDA